MPQMSGQLELPSEGRGEAPKVERSVEVLTAPAESEGSGASGLLERVLSRPNMLAAYKRVKRNKGSPGLDGMTVEELLSWLRENWERVRQDLLSGRYRPHPVKRQLIPKRGGSHRELGIPTVLDRLIQQAVTQESTAHDPAIDCNLSDSKPIDSPLMRSLEALVLMAQLINCPPSTALCNSSPPPITLPKYTCTSLRDQAISAYGNSPEPYSQRTHTICM
jgi:hypothetical protein